MGDLYSLRQTLSKRFQKKNASTCHTMLQRTRHISSMKLTPSPSPSPPLRRLLLPRLLLRKERLLPPPLRQFCLDGDSYRSIAQFKNREKIPIGMRPLMVFSGTAFESPVPNEFTLAKSLLIDFFRGETSDKIDVEGLRYIVSVTADEPTTTSTSSSSSSTVPSNSTDPASKPVLRLRVYAIRTRRSGHKLPRVELEEHGPRMDFRLGRVFRADDALQKEAMKQARSPNEERTKKNISTDTMGDKIGRIHLGKIDLSGLQTRKMKGLKRSRDVKDDDDEGEGSEGEGQAKQGKAAKRKRKVDV
jgi:ribosome production factor 2